VPKIGRSASVISQYSISSIEGIPEELAAGPLLPNKRSGFRDDFASGTLLANTGGGLHMPEEIIEPNAAETQVGPAKKKSRKLLIMIFLIVILLAGGGGGFYYWRDRAATKARAATEAAAKKALGNSGEKTENGATGDADVTEVIELQPFIVNLADTTESRYLRMTISLGIGEASEQKVDPLFTTKVRNAILATISARTSDQLLTVAGKAELRKEMLNAARSAASKPEVLTIYITDFIIQM
jgi:flagellar FliL protein